MFGDAWVMAVLAVIAVLMLGVAVRDIARDLRRDSRRSVR